MSGTTAKAVKARKRYHCDAAVDVSWGRACRDIRPGDIYVRMVCFPGDINSSSAPWVMRACPGCADSYIGPAGDIARSILREQVGEYR